MSLTKYLTENQVLLTALAVFATVAALTSTFQIKWIAGIILFCCLTAVVIIWHEMKSQMPEKMDLKLYLLKTVIEWGFYAIALYCLVEFRDFWKIFLFFPLMLLILYNTVRLAKRFVLRIPFLQRLFGLNTEKTDLQRSVIKFLFVIVSFAAFIVALWISIPVNIILDLMAQIRG